MYGYVFQGHELNHVWFKVVVSTRMSTDSCLHPTIVYRFNVVLNAFKKRMRGFPYIEASTEAGTVKKGQTSQCSHGKEPGLCDSTGFEISK